MQKQEWINMFWWSATCGREMGKCGVFIPYHSHQVIPIPISIPMKLTWRFPFLWESHGTHGNSQYILVSKVETPGPQLRNEKHSASIVTL